MTDPFAISYLVFSIKDCVESQLFLTCVTCGTLLVIALASRVNFLSTEHHATASGNKESFRPWVNFINAKSRRFKWQRVVFLLSKWFF